ncbi:hypothetical protein SAMN05216404_10494 [Nitrosospira multiformis]|uniref:TIR domain-containing protein n=1 Tax=Nitrosospira multiformis TaxID=1231 RepID=A0A1H8G4J1_9PROT|nr:hypothetical protein SAMN05216404_10494 [Nitrosospira multiformis]
MSNLFLSHSRVDELQAVTIKEWFLGKGWDVFLDFDWGA